MQKMHITGSDKPVDIGKFSDKAKLALLLSPATREENWGESRGTAICCSLIAASAAS